MVTRHEYFVLTNLVSNFNPLQNGMNICVDDNVVYNRM